MLGTILKFVASPGGTLAAYAVKSTARAFGSGAVDAVINGIGTGGSVGGAANDADTTARNTTQEMIVPSNGNNPKEVVNGLAVLNRSVNRSIESSERVVTATRNTNRLLRELLQQSANIQRQGMAQPAPAPAPANNNNMPDLPGIDRKPRGPRAPRQPRGPRAPRPSSMPKPGLGVGVELAVGAAAVAAIVGAVGLHGVLANRDNWNPDTATGDRISGVSSRLRKLKDRLQAVKSQNPKTQREAIASQLPDLVTKLREAHEQLKTLENVSGTGNISQQQMTQAKALFNECRDMYQAILDSVTGGSKASAAPTNKPVTSSAPPSAAPTPTESAQPPLPSIPSMVGAPIPKIDTPAASIAPNSIEKIGALNAAVSAPVKTEEKSLSKIDTKELTIKADKLSFEANEISFVTKGNPSTSGQGASAGSSVNPSGMPNQSGMPHSGSINPGSISGGQSGGIFGNQRSQSSSSSDGFGSGQSRNRVPGGSSAGPMDKKSDMRRGVYESFKNAGFSHEGALALSAEVGRENSFNSKTIFGDHTDPHNGKSNVGFFSWQKDRGEALKKRLGEEGLLDENGGIMKGQKSLDAMAKFAKDEMGQKQFGSGAISKYLSQDKVDPEKAAEMLGKKYIKWRYDDPRYSHHHNARRNHYAATERDVKGGSREQIDPITGKRRTTHPQEPMRDGIQKAPGMEDAYGRNSATHNAEPMQGAVMHVTGKQDVESQAEFQKKTGYGYHYVIDKDGKVVQMAGNDDRTNHMRGSNDKSRTDRLDLDNKNSLGIGFITGGKAPTKAQLEASKKVLPELYAKHGIPLNKPDGTPNYPIGHGEAQGNDSQRNRLGPRGTPEGQAMAEPFRSKEAWAEMTAATKAAQDKNKYYNPANSGREGVRPGPGMQPASTLAGPGFSAMSDEQKKSKTLVGFMRDAGVTPKMPVASEIPNPPIDSKASYAGSSLRSEVTGSEIDRRSTELEKKSSQSSENNVNVTNNNNSTNTKSDASTPSDSMPRVRAPDELFKEMYSYGVGGPM